MGECEKAARSRGLLQSHSAFAQTSEDFEDSPSISGYGDKTLSEKEWAKLLLQGSVQSNMGDVDDLHPPLDYTLHPEVLLTLQNTSANQSAAAVEGVSMNKHGDLVIFLSFLGTNGATVIIALLMISLLKRLLPAVFKRGHQAAAEQRLEQRDLAEEGSVGWISRSLSIPKDEVEDRAGLDHAMYLEFLELSMRTCAIIGAPCVLILCPLHYFCGGGAAGDDRLSRLGMGNVQHGSWLCWVHAFMVWYVVLVVHVHLHRAQKSFLPLRMRWLKEMPEPAVTTLLLQNIPEHLRTTEDLRTFFDGVFGYNAVKRIDFLKDTRELLRWRRAAEDGLQGRAAFRTGTGRVLKDEELHQVAGSMAERMRKQILHSDDVNLSCAFVTFQRRREAALAYRLLSADDNDHIRADLPPDPQEVLWQDLAVSPERQSLLELCGYFLIFLIFWGFMPVVVFIQSIANLSTLEKDVPFFKYLIEQLPVVATLWNGLMASFALTVAISLLPSLLMLIFGNFFPCKAEVNRQHKLQVWYNYFLMVYILLVTAVGSSIFTTGKHLMERPFDAPGLLASNMPKSTHFYLNFIPMQMAAYSTSGLRMAQVCKYLFFRCYYDSETAKDKSEPEDQEFTGIGSRSARAALQLSTVLTFCTLSPLISILGFFMFAVSRLIHGFLFEVENRKPDLGGVFWVSDLEEIQRGLFLFVLLMTGVLAERAGNFVPSAIAASSWVFVYWSFVTFRRRHQWEHLQVEEVLQESAEMPKSRPSMTDRYIQPELPDQGKSQSLIEAVTTMRSKLNIF